MAERTATGVHDGAVPDTTGTMTPTVTRAGGTAMPRTMRRRRGGPTLNMLVDVAQNAWWTRSWLLLVVLVLGAIAAAAAFVGQTVLPWAIYPAL